MSRFAHTMSLRAPQAGVLTPGFGAAAPRPDWDRVEAGMAQALAAVRDCARIAWWDGSAVGLRLNGLLGLFEAEAGGVLTGRRARP